MEKKMKYFLKKSRRGPRDVFFASLLMVATAFSFATMTTAIAFLSGPATLLAWADNLPLFVRQSQALTFVAVTMELTAIFCLALATTFAFYCFARRRLFFQRDSNSVKNLLFDVEQSIADWQKQMLGAGIKTPVPLEELEIHLREEIERQMKAGMDGKKAFEISVQRIGQPKMLKSEFQKSERTFMKRTLIILIGIFAVLFGPAVFLPALALHNHQGVSGSRVIVPMTVGIIITLIGVSTTIYGFKKRKA
jgi:uncharacterized membrane protein YhaH (DUF805 family)